LFLTLARTGMRLGEGLALQWENVDLAKRTIHVRHGLSLGRLETPKSGISRTVDVSRQLGDVLAKLETAHKAEKLRLGGKATAWVFHTQPGKEYDPSFVQRAFKRVVKAASLPEHFTPHCLRHTYASILLQLGVSAIYVQRQLGHASIKM